MVGHRIHFLLMISSFAMTSCNSLEKDELKGSSQFVKYTKFSKHEDINAEIDTVEFLLTIKQIDGDEVFNYNKGEKDYIYHFNYAKKKGKAVQNNDTIILHFLDRCEIKLVDENDSRIVYKFISLEPSIDNANYYFVIPQLGIVIKKSTTWPIYSELTEHYLDKKNDFKLFISLIYNNRDFFSKIPIEKPPLIPNE